MIDFQLLQVVPAMDEDYEFSFQVKKQAQGPWITQRWGWDEEKQRTFHRKDWDQKRPSLITYAGMPIGTIRLADDDAGLEIQQFFLLLEYQNQRIGTYLLQGILRQADGDGKAVRLTILKGSRVESLYRRLGFRVVRQDETFCFMERSARRVHAQDA